MDVKTAFLNGDLENEMYLEQQDCDVDIEESEMVAMQTTKESI